MPLARIFDEFYPPAVIRLRAAARAGALREVHRLDIGRARFRDWFFSDPYVAPGPRPLPDDTNPMEYLMDNHDDDRVAILPSDITPATLATAENPENLPAPAAFAHLRDEARTPTGWSAPAIAPAIPHDAPDPAPRAAGTDPAEPVAFRPRRATVQRQAMIYSLFHDPYELALTGHITPLDIMEAVSRRLVANGHLLDAARVAANAAPYRHPRQELEPDKTPDQPPA